MNFQRRRDVGSPQARLMGLRYRNLAQWFARSHLPVVLLVMAVVCASATQASGEWVVLTLKAYAPSTLPVRSTTLEVADIHDQLEISRQAALFAISDSGWNLGAVGGQLHSLPTPQWSAWVWGINNILPSMDGNLAQRMGYDLNAEAVANPGPNGPEYFLWFHTDAWAERLSHNVGEEPNNFGSIAGCTGGVWFQCPVPHWGSFSVQPVPEPATLTLLLIGGAIALCRQKRRKTLRALCLAFALLALAPAFALAGPNFGTPQNYAVGAHPQGLGVADFNRDGRLDLAVGNRDNGTVSFLYGQPGGGFGGRWDIAVALPELASMAVADFNRDGLPDLALAAQMYDYIPVLYGRTDGNFGIRQFPAPSGPHYVTAADLDGDGYPDLAVSNYGSNTLTLFYGNAGGDLEARQVLSPGGAPFDHAIADFNRDGRLDIAAAVAPQNKVAVFYSQSNGTLGAQHDYAAGAHAHSLAIADFDRDGWLDLVTGNYVASSITLLYGSVDGFTRRQDYPAESGALVSGDFNLDGLADVVVTGMGTNTVMLLYGQPGGGLGGREDFTVGLNPAWIIAEDLDLNGGLDLIVANEHDNTVSVLYNAMPEPATLSLLAVGALALLGRRRA